MLEEESIDITTPEGLKKAGLKEVVCTRCGAKSTFAIMVPVPDDYACMECMQTGIMADDVGVLPIWDEKPGKRKMKKDIPVNTTERPICPQCDTADKMVKHGDKWVCHGTHMREDSTESRER